MHSKRATIFTDDTLELVRRFNVCENPEYIQIIWCDARCADDIKTNDGQTDYDILYTKRMLNALSVKTQFFSNIDQCIEQVKSTENSHRIVLVVSGSFASTILSIIHSYRPISFVFVFCENNDEYLPLLSQYNKIVNIYTTHEPLRSSICEKLDLLEKQTFQFTVFDQRQKSTRDLTEHTVESLGFLADSILLDIVKRMPADEHAKKQLIDMCLEFFCDSKYDIMMIERFRTTFKPEDAIKWYTKNCFLFRLLNRALRTETFELIFAFRFFIIVLCNVLKNEKQKLPSNTTYTLFRGQKMLLVEVDRLRKRIGDFIVTNSFLSTTTDVEVALMFAGHGAEHPETLCIVLFEIKANSNVELVTFAPIESESNFADECEVLFDLNAVFGIDSIDFDERYQVWRVQMTATDDGSRYIDKFLKAGLATEERKAYTPLTFYGHVLWYEFHQVNKAELYFQNLVKTLPSNHSALPIIYYELGCLYHKQEQWSEALLHLAHARDLLCALKQEKSEHMAMFWHATGEVLYDKGNADESLDCLQRALSIWDLDDEHIEKARTIEYIGRAYERKNSIDDHDKVLNYYNQAVTMYQRILLMDDDNIKNCFERMGNFYDTIGRFDLGLDSYRRAASPILYSKCENFDTFSGNLNRLINILKKRVAKFGSESTVAPVFLLLTEVMNFRIDILGEDEDQPMIAIIIACMGDICEGTETLPITAYYELAICKLELSLELDSVRTIIVDYVDKLDSIYEEAEDYENVMKCLKKKLAIQQKYYSPHSMEIVSTWYQMGNIHKEIDSHPKEVIECFTQAVNLYDSIERPDKTRPLRNCMSFMIDLETRFMDLENMGDFE